MTKARDLANIISGGFTADDIPNLDASKITSGSIADARIPASAVSQHASSFDDNKIVNDISTLALRQASDQNKSAYNTNSQSVDVFQDDTGIDVETNTDRDSNEFVSSAVDESKTQYLYDFEGSGITNSGTASRTGITETYTFDVSGQSSSVPKFGTNGMYPNGQIARTLRINKTGLIGSSDDFTLEFFYNNRGFNTNGYTSVFAMGSDDTNATEHHYIYKQRSGIGGQYFYGFNNGTTGSLNSYIGTTDNQYRHIVFGRKNGTLALFIDGTRAVNYSNDTVRYDFLTIGNGAGGVAQQVGYDGVLVSLNASKYDMTQSSLTVPTSQYGEFLQTSISATGNFTGTTITAPSSVSSMGAIITYQDNAGTNALNTDIVLQLSADGGSNYSTATLTAMPDFATGIKMAKVNDLAVTAGTQLKYKISFANQASGSKEARIRGVSLQY
jgi:hypothetical protein